jgi:aspartate ammonia-lyase
VGWPWSSRRLRAANREIGALSAEKADLIDRASQLVIEGEYHDQFVVGVIQGGAGTSTNMNANEVITNIALELAGREKGDYAFLSPIDDTNRSQSTNDVYPTAIKVGLSLDLLTLLEELDLLRRAFLDKAVEFHDILKVGRTQLQDAVPMTLGQEFNGFATTLGEDHSRLKENAYLLYEINMGATAIGTGITTHPEYGKSVLRHLREISGLDLTPRPIWSNRRATPVRSCRSPRRSSATRSSCRRSATTCDCSHPDRRPGFGEINLPARQAGSSIMPGKVNPGDPRGRQPGRLRGRGRRHDGDDGGRGGSAAAERVRAGHRALRCSSRSPWMRRGMHTLRVNCVDGITANTERLGAMVGASVGVITALTPFIGYAAAAALAKTALLTGRNVAGPRRRSRPHVTEECMKQLSPARLSGLETVTAAIPVVYATIRETLDD